MSAPIVRRLGDLRRADAAEVGGKAAQLGELIAAGARVPDGLVLTVAGCSSGAASGSSSGDPMSCRSCVVVSASSR